MTAALIGLTALCVLVLYLRESAHDNRVASLVATFQSAHEHERDEWTNERQLLIDRIERPGSVYAPRTDAPPVPEEPPSEFEVLRRRYEGVEN